MTLNPSFGLSRWTRFHRACLILSVGSFLKVGSGGDAEAKADELGCFLREGGPGTSSHISVPHVQEKKLRTFSLLLFGLGEFLLVLFFDFFFFPPRLLRGEKRGVLLGWAGGQAAAGAASTLESSPHPDSQSGPGRTPTHPRAGAAAAGAEQTERRPSPPPPPPPAPLRGEGRGGERGGTCEPSPNCRVHPFLPGSGGGPQGAPLLDSSSLFNIQVGMPPLKAVRGGHLKFQV